VAATAPWKGGQGEAEGEDKEGDDPRLARMKTKIKDLRLEKDREKGLLSIEARERELSREIIERELRGAVTGGGEGAS
jgi:hypothetical protein